MLFMNVHDVADHELYRGPWADPQPSRYPYRPPRGDAPFKLAFHNADTDTDILAEFCARILARMSVRDACVYTCKRVLYTIAVGVHVGVGPVEFQLNTPQLSPLPSYTHFTTNLFCGLLVIQ